MAIDLEREEECLTNNLQKQLRQIGIEKQETEAEVENLKRQLEDMRTEREKVSSLSHMTSVYVQLRMTISDLFGALTTDMHSLIFFIHVIAMCPF